MAQPQSNLDWYAEHGEDLDRDETEEWLESLEDVVAEAGPERAQYLLKKLLERGYERGVHLPFTANTPYINTIPRAQQPALSGRPRDRAPHQEPGPLERHGDGRARQQAPRGASAATSRPTPRPPRSTRSASTTSSAAAATAARGDLIYFQGHASPGIYARAFLEGRLDETQLENFRRELEPEGGALVLPAPVAHAGLLAVPHRVDGPRADHAPSTRRASTATCRTAASTTPRGSRVWASSATARPTSPRSLGAITLASREKLDNLIFVVNCNLQRLDGPVRGNGKIIQELEAVFRGAGWNVIKVIWGERLGPAARQRDQTACSSSAWARSSTASTRSTPSSPAATSASTSSASTRSCSSWSRTSPTSSCGSCAAAATTRRRSTPPTRPPSRPRLRRRSILAKTIKGYGLGEAGEGRNITHQQKKLNEDELKRLPRPLRHPDRPTTQLQSMPLLPAARGQRGDRVPARAPRARSAATCRAQGAGASPAAAEGGLLRASSTAAGDREVSTTMVFVQILRKLLKRPGDRQARSCRSSPTRRAPSAWTRCSSSSASTPAVGQLYEPVDSKMLLSYREAKTGRSSRRASPRPARWRRSSPPARRTRRTACR